MISNNRRASILIEALLAVLILSISLTVIIQSLTAAYRASRSSWRYTRAAMALDNAVIEQIYKGGTQAGSDEEGNLEKPFEDYHFRTVSRPVVINGKSNDRFNDVVMSVDWNQGGRQSRLDVRTFLFNTAKAKMDIPADDF